ncbi:hypothetical protein ElyMa_002142400 [Elysia marginata]|uniref:Uncharacterized protein n=1 Tax=Elysia marginata TaxID=1093978 RepID=A0AAV4FL20_9GAST|nr:hypothetical protein ElyMa_002142400 [Elysia marginata]
MVHPSVPHLVPRVVNSLRIETIHKSYALFESSSGVGHAVNIQRSALMVWFGCLNFNVPVNLEVIAETALGTIESVLPHCGVRGACIHHIQTHYSDIGPIRLNTKSIMPDTKRISC